MIYPEKLAKAVQFASQKHKGQKRMVLDYPFISHPLVVMYLVSKFTDDIDVLCAAVLHDVIEDTGVNIEEIRDIFGKNVMNLVDILTQEENDNYNEKYDIYLERILKSENKNIFLIKSADILYNLMDTNETLMVEDNLIDNILIRFEKYYKNQFEFIDKLEIAWKGNPFLDDLKFYRDGLKIKLDNRFL